MKVMRISHLGDASTNKIAVSVKGAHAAQQLLVVAAENKHLITVLHCLHQQL